MPEVDIVVPTYNAALWLNDLFESVLAQNNLCDFKIIARDDASKDSTPEALSAWQQRLGGRMQILPAGKNLGMIGNYGALLESTSAPWVMLADPDDVWLSNKMEISISAMHDAERTLGVDHPIAFFTDAEVADAALRPIASSFWKWMRQNPDSSQRFSSLLLDCPALTSTIIVNRALVEMTLPFSEAAFYPDWLIALTACCFGTLLFSREATVKYRRHAANDSVAPTSSNLLSAAGNLGQSRARVRSILQNCSMQATKFLHHFNGRIPPQLVSTVQAVANLPKSSFLARRWMIVRHNLWFSSPIKNVAVFLLQ